MILVAKSIRQQKQCKISSLYISSHYYLTIVHYLSECVNLIATFRNEVRKWYDITLLVI